MKVIEFGCRDYGEILALQEELFQKLIESKKAGIKGEEYILIGEHPPVITMGRRAKESNLLLSREIFEEKGIKVYHIGRGGDVTYHCPGQLVVYPVIDLERHGFGVKSFVDFLEECVILFLAAYGVKGERIEGKTGVWIGKGTGRERKICAIGIKCSHFCTMHGLSININADLSGFSYINPCGFSSSSVTSLQLELDSRPE